MKINIYFIAILLVVYLCFWLGKILRKQRVKMEQEGHMHVARPENEDRLNLMDGVLMSDKQGIVCNMYNGYPTDNVVCRTTDKTGLMDQYVAQPSSYPSFTTNIANVVDDVLQHKKEEEKDQLVYFKDKFGQLTQEELNNIELILKSHKNG